MSFLFHIFIISILIRIRHLVLEDLDKLVEDDGKDGANTWADPCTVTVSDTPLRWEGEGCELTVNPMLVVIYAGDDARTKTARWVERTTGVVYADEFGNEESEADADGCDECRCRPLASFQILRSGKCTHPCASPLPT